MVSGFSKIGVHIKRYKLHNAPHINIVIKIVEHVLFPLTTKNTASNLSYNYHKVNKSAQKIYIFAVKLMIEYNCRNQKESYRQDLIKIVRKVF